MCETLRETLQPEPAYIEPRTDAPLELRWALLEAKLLVTLRQQQLRRAVNQLREVWERALSESP